MSNKNELAFIEWIRRHSRSAESLRVGIGDDAAVWQTYGQQLLFTTDVLMEGVDFLLPDASPSMVGRKAMAVNLSDIAAMAGRPLAALIGVALPKSRGIEFASELQHGMQALADEFQVTIIGGDTNIWDGPLVISITLIGEGTNHGPVQRSGAKVGDWLFVTGPLGGSILGKHFTFLPRIQEALRLNETLDLHAMIDVSDGLSTDLHHLCDESCVGATLFGDKIPFTDAAFRMSDGKSLLYHALTDGEDFELLFAVSAEDGQKLTSGVVDVPAIHIGEIDATLGCRLRNADGRVSSIERAGWEHSF